MLTNLQNIELAILENKVNFNGYKKLTEKFTANLNQELNHTNHADMPSGDLERLITFTIIAASKGNLQTAFTHYLVLNKYHGSYEVRHNDNLKYYGSSLDEALSTFRLESQTF